MCFNIFIFCSSPERVEDIKLYESMWINPTEMMVNLGRGKTGYYPTPGSGRGIVFRRFLSLFLCQQHYETGPICIKFSGKVWSDRGTT